MKIMLVFGTRPEAIKLAPVIHELKLQPSKFKPVVCVTAQHRQMLDQVLRLFEIVRDYDLDIMSDNQDLFDITKKTLEGLKAILKKEQPDIVLVQGDTTTTFMASLAAFYCKIPIGHVEGGLRTYNKYQPFPEEKNRQMTTVLADYHFAPTEWAKQNLVKEGISSDRIWVTGNTGIDALLTILRGQKSEVRRKFFEEYFKKNWNLTLSSTTNNSKLILVTGHRRENFGEGFKNICLALKEIAQRNPDVTIVYPVHLNPNVQKPVFKILSSKEKVLGNLRNIYLIEPLDYAPFVYLMDKSYLILTDSGGVQEEAPSLGKPALVMRNTTERPEGVESGNTKLVGTNFNKIVMEVQRLLNDKTAYEEMSSKQNSYGDGKAAERIVDILSKYCG